jgi:hypothetical protein
VLIVESGQTTTGGGPGAVGGAGRRFPLLPLMVMALVSLIDQIDVSVARGVRPSSRTSGAWATPSWA